MSLSKKRIFYIDSRNRIEGTDSNFLCQLDFAREYYYLQAKIPKSYYLVGRGENTFTLTEGILSTTITIPVGNYTRTNLKTTLQATLTQSSPNGWVYAVSVPSSSQPETGKYTFTVTGNGGVQPIFTSSICLWEQIGFNENSVNTFSANQLTSTNVVKLQIEDFVYIHSDMCTNGNDSILQAIYVADIQDYSNITTSIQMLGHILSPLFRIRITFIDFKLAMNIIKRLISME